MIYLAGVILLVACFLVPELKRFVLRVLAVGAVLGVIGFVVGGSYIWYRDRREAADRAAARVQGAKDRIVANSNRMRAAGAPDEAIRTYVQHEDTLSDTVSGESAYVLVRYTNPTSGAPSTRLARLYAEYLRQRDSTAPRRHYDPENPFQPESLRAHTR